MAAITADFELGTTGNTVATGDTGSATAWNRIDGTPAYSTTHPAHGSKGVTIGAANSAVGWIAAFGTQTDAYGRIYLYLTANPGSDGNLIQWADSGVTVQQLSLTITSAGKIKIINANAATTSTNSVSLNQLVRVEYHFHMSTTAATGEAKLYNTADSITATETLSWASTTPGANAGCVRHGNMAGFSASTVFLDNIVAAATAYPGPFPVSTTAPTISGSTPVGSVLTCDGGTWNTGGTFTLTYQWTRDGSNIGSATSSTYTTVSADANHAVGCTVTATGIQATNESALQASSNTITPTVLFLPGPPAVRNQPVLRAALR